LEHHPQVRGYKNVISNISKYIQREPDFADCVSITTEKGIAHDKEKNKLCLYYPESLQWGELESLLGFQFSDVINCFDLNFGWRLDAKVARYTNRGAIIEVSNGDDKKYSPPAPSSELAEFRRRNLGCAEYMTLVYPAEAGTQPVKEATTTAPIGTKVTSEIPKIEEGQNYWIITGYEENLRHGIKNGLWGVRKDPQGQWDNVRNGDLLFFYCVRPIGGLVGFGEVTGTHIDTKPFWPNENPRAESKYPLRITFCPITVKNNWLKDRMSISGTGIEFYHGLNYVEPEKRHLLIKKIGTKNE
jgi:hypothetical protein